MSTKVPASNGQEFIEWARKNQALLLAKWDEYNPEET